MKLYYAPASSYSQRVLIALYEKDAAFTPIEVNLFDKEERSRYTKINPFGKIPTLETESGQILFEACIIIEHIDQYFQYKPYLIPQDPKLALEVRMLERIVDVYINRGRDALFSDSQRPVEEQGSSEVNKARRLLETACLQLEERLSGRTWLAGEEFSLADCAAAPTLSYLRMVYSYKHLPKLTDYVRRLESRPSVARVQNSGREQMVQMLSALKNPLELVPLDNG
ncbi:glutathione S-transferase [Scytonema hofmannii PCC 7110]|uniref:Glutathione S-transferase n=1 Tax=Scytonema hofmannii PCC 7110 TaxID=128403 RepID=A0A139X0L8_9CYAN|nr:glutathione S-transferase family protein [Scytonema hofmannii]KYC38251.1 glutathione S-transferase [Scytonema hofmannii PCC 7110]